MLIPVTQSQLDRLRRSFAEYDKLWPKLRQVEWLEERVRIADDGKILMEVEE